MFEIIAVHGIVAMPSPRPSRRSCRVARRAVVGGVGARAPRQRRLLRAEIRTSEAGDLHPRQVHVARQVDGRLGIAPAPHARPRLVRRPLGMRGVIRGVNVDTELLHRQLPVALLDRRARHDGAPTPPSGRTARRGRRSCRSRRCGATATTSSRLTIGRPWTHLRLNIFPDGGVARLRVYGEVVGRLGAVGARRRWSISPRSATAASCSARATCTSAPRTT